MQSDRQVSKVQPSEQAATAMVSSSVTFFHLWGGKLKSAFEKAHDAGNRISLAARGAKLWR